MGAHHTVIDRMSRVVAAATTTAARDAALDQLWDVISRATEWDAKRWDFPDDWMQAERDEMNRRAQNMGFWPGEASGDELARRAGVDIPRPTQGQAAIGQSSVGGVHRGDTSGNSTRSN